MKLKMTEYLLRMNSLKEIVSKESHERKEQIAEIPQEKLVSDLLSNATPEEQFYEVMGKGVPIFPSKTSCNLSQVSNVSITRLEEGGIDFETKMRLERLKGFHDSNLLFFLFTQF